MPKNDGGPAFPFSFEEWGVNPNKNSKPFKITHSGMSLRDWFAGQYLAGVASRDLVELSQFSSIATDAYNMADAMIEARNK